MPQGKKPKKESRIPIFGNAAYLQSYILCELRCPTQKYMNKLLNLAYKNGLTAEFHQSIVSANLNDEKQGVIDYVGMCTQVS